MFFILSLLANLTYGAGVSLSQPGDIWFSTNGFQILCHSTEKNYIVTNVPWLIGSLGTMAEDVVIFVQFRLYAAHDPERTTAVP